MTNEQFKHSSLVLVPTDLEPGIYEDAEGPIMVTKFNNGNYLILYPHDEYEKFPDNSIIFHNAYVKDMSIEYDSDDCISVENVNVNFVPMKLDSK